MAGNKLGVLHLLLLCGAILLSVNPETARAKLCPQICTADIAYMTCPSSGNEHLTPPACNCCFAGEGCTLYYADGTAICTGT
ncbi:proteinase inhibitor PSI-1.2-like [Alnus glutinosa]|uniref:proteinase inhibitor PSI-1.2-like n=1 Tax=Alnus glutinosa TaxID=3517 RepID=UPI002D769FED|nr:proteinase inhibitor PSI-1.2-like [Alnus glutinosa]